MNILVFVSKETPRIQYTFKQICNRILGLQVHFTTKIEDFIAFDGVKFSYGKKQLGKEIFIEESGLLQEQGFTDIDIQLGEWDGVPCFFSVSKESDIPFDFFSAAFYLLTRYEEYQPYVKDMSGGFPVEESLAVKGDFLKRPVIDLWAYKFKQILTKKFEVEFPKRKFEVNTIVAVEEAFAYRNKGIVRLLGGGIRDLLALKFAKTIERIKVVFRLAKDPYDIYDELIDFVHKHQIKLLFMFQLSDFSKENRNINYNNRRYHHLIKSMGDYAYIGLLPGFDALQNLKVFSKEKQRWEDIIRHNLEATLIKRFPMNFPESYIHFMQSEIKMDFSMGYQKELGFRAGTSSPYLFYDLNLEQTSPLKIYPYLLNSLIFEKYNYDEVRLELETIKEELSSVGGNFNMIFDNRDFANPYQNHTYSLLKFAYGKH
ncbi:MAG: DUF7033 domain-containing protein [Bacteroidota bacterium]